MPKYMTKQRKILTDYLEKCHDELVSAHEIADALADEGISLSAVYRNITELENEGKLRKVSQNANREALYQYTAAKECHDHIHLSCKKCGKMIHLESEGEEQLIRAIATDAGFELNKNDTVLYGVCKQCK